MQPIHNGIACKKLTVEEYTALSEEDKGKGFSKESDCDCCASCEANESCCEGRCCDSGAPIWLGCNCGECGGCPIGYCKTSGTAEEGPFCDGNPFKINCEETFADGLYTYSYCDNV